MSKQLPWFSALILIAMALSENAYFGWNPVPKSDAEMVCDLMILGFTAVVWSRS